ncbi:MAG TPA: serine hydrolase domain-containing protein [Trueperaceae bacterium]|nr:serine hydrolase domain-containing protein [Trueperaceae bacterium]
MTMDAAAAARSLLEDAIARRVTPGAVLHAVARDGRELRLAVGCLTYDEGSAPVTEDTVYDLASLTKVVSCLPLLLHLLAAGEVRLDDKVSRFFANAGWFQERSLGDVTLEDLALHRSGLPAWRPVFANVSERRTALANVLQTHLTEEPGSFVYSDLGVIVLGAVVERVMGERIDAAFRRVVAEPLGLATASYAPLPADVQVAPTEDDGLRGLLRGEVHDENAWVMDGVSSHAGLFGTAADLSRYAAAWLSLEAPFAPAPWLAEAVTDRSRGHGPARGLLWRLRDDGDWPIGDGVSARAFGHTGFTGTSIVVDPEAGWTCVLLTNRVHPRRGEALPVALLRRSVHELVARTFGG